MLYIIGLIFISFIVNCCIGWHDFKQEELTPQQLAKLISFINDRNENK